MLKSHTSLFLKIFFLAYKLPVWPIFDCLGDTALKIALKMTVFFCTKCPFDWGGGQGYLGKAHLKEDLICLSLP